MKYVLIFTKTLRERTPYDSWLSGTDITPIIMAAEEVAASYAHLPLVYSFKNYDKNQRLQQKAWELTQTKNIIAIFARAEADIIRAAQLRDLAKIQGQKTESALAYRDKIKMKDYLQKTKVSLPKYLRLQSAYDLLKFSDLYQFPLVVKPVSESGSFGTHILQTQKDLNVFLQNTNVDGYEVETFVDGQMFHIDGFVRNGNLEFIHPSRYINDCLSFRQDEFVGSITLSADNPAYMPLVETTKQVIAALPATKNMVFHCELWLQKNGHVVFCEIASRTGGAMIGSVIHTAFGINLDKEWFLAECEIKSELKLQADTLAAGVWIPPKKGILQTLPTDLPDWVVDHQQNGVVGKTYNGGEKSGLFLAGYIFAGTSEETLQSKIVDTVNWFRTHSSWA